MNAQRWLAVASAVVLVVIVATTSLWLPLIQRKKDRSTPTPNTNDFVLEPETPDAATPAIVATRALGVRPTLDPVVAGLMAETGLKTLAVGDDPYIVMAGDFTLIDDLHRAEGTASIYKIGDKTYALRLDPFTVTPGPDLHVLLSLNAEPRTSADALLPSHMDLGPLKSASGPQNYDIPDQATMTRFKSVVIYSISLNLVYSTATLTQVRG